MNCNNALLLALLLSPFALAQEPTQKTNEGGDATAATTVEQPPASQASPADQSNEAATASPTDYRASEQISEDLSVSFPVDI